jgi:hypothetical protein
MIEGLIICFVGFGLFMGICMAVECFCIRENVEPEELAQYGATEEGDTIIT